MSARPESRADQQRRDAPPIRRSAWVSANAGSGKTHVLAQRVMRLLLAGVPPAQILCLTFTKAAAANMAERVFDSAVEMDARSTTPRSLQGDRRDRRRPRADAQTLDFARRLFARAVETPGGLKIQTIHAFCERLLHIFPFEANVPARFRSARRVGAARIARTRAARGLDAAERDDGRLARGVATRSPPRRAQDDFDTLC